MLAVLTVAAMLTIARILRPERPQNQKYVSYESGVDPVGEGWSQSTLRYYLFALLFVMFDVEAVFIFPWATRLEVYGVFGARGDGHLHLHPGTGLFYAWRKRVLQWV